jgi:YHS domain-containing protein
MIFTSLLIWSATVWATTTSNLNKSGVILDGYDATSYFKGVEPIKGSAQFQVKTDEAIYWFANEDNKQAFMKDPKKFEPQYGGWCAYAVAESKEKVEVDPKSFVIQDGRLLLFYNGVWADTKKKWLNTKNKNAKEYLAEADKNWPQVKTKAP